MGQLKEVEFIEILFTTTCYSTPTINSIQQLIASTKTANMLTKQKTRCVCGQFGRLTAPSQFDHRLTNRPHLLSRN